jgi:hypothetical protein
VRSTEGKGKTANVSFENTRERQYLKDVSPDRKIILKYEILQKDN